MTQVYHSAYGVPLSGVDHEFMRFLELRRAIPTGRAGGLRPEPQASQPKALIPIAGSAV